MKNQKNVLKEQLKKLISKRVVQLREQQGLTVLELAQRSNISKEKLMKIEKNLQLPRLYTIYNICNGLEIKLYDFFDSKEFDNYKSVGQAMPDLQRAKNPKPP